MLSRPTKAYISKTSFQYGFSVFLMTEVVLVCSPLMVATANGSGNPKVHSQITYTIYQTLNTYGRHRACITHRQQLLVLVNRKGNEGLMAELTCQPEVRLAVDLPVSTAREQMLMVLLRQIGIHPEYLSCRFPCWVEDLTNDTKALPYTTLCSQSKCLRLIFVPLDWKPHI